MCTSENSVWREITSNSVCWCGLMLRQQSALVYCSLGAGIISELFSRSLKWPERLGVLQTQKVLMAETWSFSGGCLIISAFLQLIQCNKTHATAANQIIRGLNLHNWSPALSSSISASVSFCPSLPSSYSHFRHAFLICLSFYSPHFPFHSSFLLPFFFIYFSLPSFILFFFLTFLFFFLSFFTSVFSTCTYCFHLLSFLHLFLSFFSFSVSNCSYCPKCPNLQSVVVSNKVKLLRYCNSVHFSSICTLLEYFYVE